MAPDHGLICYASHTTTRRNLAALRKAGWRVLISAAAPQHWDARGFRYCLDPGAWHYFHHGLPFNDDAYERMIDKLGAGADFIILPDIVAGGIASLELSVRWMNRTMASGAPLVLVAVQDGMTPADLEPLVGPAVGIFLGGSTEWKLATAVMWGRWCAARPFDHPLSTPENPRRGCWYHVARVNTRQRFGLAADAGATSTDGSSGTRFAKNVPTLARWAAEPSLVSPLERPA